MDGNDRNGMKSKATRPISTTISKLPNFVIFIGYEAHSLTYSQSCPNKGMQPVWLISRYRCAVISFFISSYFRLLFFLPLFVSFALYSVYCSLHNFTTILTFLGHAVYVFFFAIFFETQLEKESHFEIKTFCSVAGFSDHSVYI